MSLENNIWWTRKARIQSEKRLLSAAFHAQLILFWYSFLTVSAAILHLYIAPDSELSQTIWLIFSILVLAMSGFLNGFSFKERALLFKENYEFLNLLYQTLKNDSSNPSVFKDVSTEYKRALNLSENHTDQDFFNALCFEHLTHQSPYDEENGLDKHPTRFIWLLFWFGRVFKYFVLFVLYLLIPTILFYIGNFGDCFRAI